MILEKFDFNKFLKTMENGAVLMDFDARNGHNHRTKFRMRQDPLPDLYEKAKNIE